MATPSQTQCDNGGRKHMPATMFGTADIARYGATGDEEDVNPWTLD